MAMSEGLRQQFRDAIAQALERVNSMLDEMDQLEIRLRMEFYSRLTNSMSRAEAPLEERFIMTRKTKINPQDEKVNTQDELEMRGTKLSLDRIREIKAEWRNYRIEKKLDALMIGEGMQEELSDIDSDAENGFQAQLLQEEQRANE